MKKLAVFILIACFTILQPIHSSTFAATGKGNELLNKLFEEHGTEQKGSLVNVEKVKQNTKKLELSSQVIGIDIAVFFFIFGWAIIILAVGLKHPEYQKWGRATIVTSVVGYICVRFGPILFYAL